MESMVLDYKISTENKSFTYSNWPKSSYVTGPANDKLEGSL